MKWKANKIKGSESFIVSEVDMHYIHIHSFSKRLTFQKCIYLLFLIYLYIFLKCQPFCKRVYIYIFS